MFNDTYTLQEKNINLGLKYPKFMKDNQAQMTTFVLRVSK